MTIKKAKDVFPPDGSPLEVMRLDEGGVSITLLPRITRALADLRPGVATLVRPFLSTYYQPRLVLPGVRPKCWSRRTARLKRARQSTRRRQDHIEPRLDHAGQIHRRQRTTPMFGKVWSFANQLCYCRLLLWSEPWFRSSRYAVAEPGDAFGVVA